MKKLGILAVCILFIGAFLLLSGCPQGPMNNISGGDSAVEDNYYVLEEWDQFGNGKITFAINGHELPPALQARAAAQAQARALTHNRAFSLSQNFEVVFRSANDQTKIARATWISGDSPSIPAVDTDGTNGVNYAKADQAILFAGRGNTLFGVGLLTAVYQENSNLAVTPTNPTDPVNISLKIDHKTVAVTFTVAALLSGAAFEPEDSSFQMYDALWQKTTPGPAPTVNITPGNTVINRAKPGDTTEWPIYLIPENQPSYFDFTFDTTGIPYTGQTKPIEKYLPGIRVRNEQGTEASLVKPKVATPSPAYAKGQSFVDIPGDKAWGLTGVILKSVDSVNEETAPTLNTVDSTAFTTNDMTAFDPLKDDVFGGKIVLKLDAPPLTAIGSVNFELPVIALTDSDRKAKIWYIKNGYSTDNLYLDDGLNGTGGAILLGIGNVTNLGISLGWIIPVPVTGISITGATIGSGGAGSVGTIGGNASAGYTLDYTTGSGGTTTYYIVLTPTIAPATATNTRIKWTSDTPTVLGFSATNTPGVGGAQAATVTVDGNVNVNLVASGTSTPVDVTITAQSIDNPLIKVDIVITVHNP